MLKTFIIDGDKGGVGKSLAARALVQHYAAKPEAERPRIVVYDADLSNPDVCGTGGLTKETLGSGIVSAAVIDLSTENGWIELGTNVELIKAVAEKTDYRIIVNMPAQIGPRAFDGSIYIVNEVLKEANAVPVWLLSRTQESIRALNYRLHNMPKRYETGVILKNLFFGSTDKFALWAADDLRQHLVENGAWIEADLPELNDQLGVNIGRRPFHVVLGSGIDGKPLQFGYRLALQSWLKRASDAFATIEQIGGA